MKQQQTNNRMKETKQKINLIKWKSNQLTMKQNKNIGKFNIEFAVLCLILALCWCNQAKRPTIHEQLAN